MQELTKHQETLLKSISLEVKEQEKRYRLGDDFGLKQLKREGVALHPVTVKRKSFGYADYPEIAFSLPYSLDTSNFKDNSAIECFLEGEEPVKGVLIGMTGKRGSFRLFSPDFPDWIEEKGVGIKLAPDHYTSERMSQAVRDLHLNKPVYNLFQKIHGEELFGKVIPSENQLEIVNSSLNESQVNAVNSIVNNEELLIIHGPPGTGKTTTLIEGLYQEVRRNKKIIVSAPSNAAVDNLAKGLISRGLKILRVGNTIKVDDEIFPFTNEGRMKDSSTQKNIKRLKIQAEEFRRMAQQYKRKFGKEEREQRSLLYKEVKRIRKEVRELRDYFDDKLFAEAEIVIGTPIGLVNFLPESAQFDSLVVDEAGQCLEPLAWLIFPFAKKWVLAGDPYQLPPTVLSSEAVRNGFDVSILEQSFRNCENIMFLDTQYRMRESIAEFSNQFFYKGILKTPEFLEDKGVHVSFFDTAGAGFEEESGKDGGSLLNRGELSIIKNMIEQEGVQLATATFLSPYSGQIQLARETLPTGLKLSTIDSFQGQEGEAIIISLVRSNPDAVIGFLKDYRRMNVALTRAKDKLIVIGDSSTIGQDKFYQSFFEFVEKIDGYRSVWEFIE